MPKYRELDNRRMKCPEPVIQTKQALEELIEEQVKHFTLVSIVDNEESAEHIARFARRTGYQVEVERRDSDFHILILYDEDQHSPCQVNDEEETTLFLVTSNTLGEGSAELGDILTQGLFTAMLETCTLPGKLIFLNSGVDLVRDDSPILSQLKRMEAGGVEIMACGTCLDYYGIKDRLAVGSTTNMYNIVENIRDAAKCVRL